LIQEMIMEIRGQVAIVTGAGSGIGQAVAIRLARCGLKALGLIDRSDSVRAVADAINQAAGGGQPIAEAFLGDTTDEAFQTRTIDRIVAQYGTPTICVPAAGITRDQIAVKLDKATGRAVLYPRATFRQVVEVDLIAPIYWALEMIGRVAEARHRRGLGRWRHEEGIQGSVILISSISSHGNPGQIAYSSAKAGLDGAEATLAKEAIFYGIHTAVIHPGFTDTPMVRAMGEDAIQKNILPYTRLGRLIEPAEIAEAICFLITNPEVSGQLWADAGWHPPF
jgi:NAD(P)-dependent dehydrogenase (short-subunit alcohol dehydrogenase family)